MVRAVFIFCMAALVSACNLVPGSREAEAPRVSNTGTFAASPAAGQCIARLDRTGSVFEAVPDRYYGAGCSTLNAVNMQQIGGDDARFTLTNIGAVTCPTANSFAGWARFGVDRAARQILGSELVRIETMGSYACRNIAGSNKRSAHSKAEAIDIAAFILADGRRIEVRSDWDGGTSEERRFLRTIHGSACKRFGTVLGPEYNAAHRDHFHLEVTGGNFCR